MSPEALPAGDDVNCASEVSLPVQKFDLRHRNRNGCGTDTFYGRRGVENPGHDIFIIKHRVIKLVGISH